ncbi:MAG: phytanoyl-CoA dioxygenase family protein [Albidovulum sp.]|nr:phytanoyl-CoA dioxygenase family protein [Albidovulum sp.]
MLDQTQIDKFHREGFLIARNVVPRDAVQALQAEIEATIDWQAQMLRERGEIAEMHEDADFLHRTALLHAQSPRILDPIAHGIHTGPAIFNLLTCPAILDIMEQLLGPEILVSSIYRLRPKLPGLAEGVIPWHQDSAYFHSCADDDLVPTFWVPLMNATVESGCMEVLPGCHRKGVLRHYWADLRAPGLSVHPDHMPDVKPVPVPAGIGDAVIMTNLTPHRSTDNVSSLIRWSADIRFNSPEAGDYGPNEASFLGRSKVRPDDVITDWREFEKIRANHVPSVRIDRTWLRHDKETFLNPEKRVDLAR